MVKLQINAANAASITVTKTSKTLTYNYNCSHEPQFKTLIETVGIFSSSSSLYNFVKLILSLGKKVFDNAFVTKFFIYDGICT